MRRVITIAAAAGLAASVLTMPAVADDDSSAQLSEQRLGNLTGEWWQWAYSIPNIPQPGGEGSIHPLVGDNDDSGDPNLFEYCGNGQHGDVWFLGGDFSGTGEFFERTCVIPFGKTILVPVINYACATAQGDATKSATATKQNEELQECTKPVADLFTGTASFGPKGGPLEYEPVRRLSPSKAFRVFFAPDNVGGTDPSDPNPSLAYADGQWVALSDLAPGYYRLEFQGVFDDPSSPGVEFEINGAYNIIIARKNGLPPARN